MPKQTFLPSYSGQGLLFGT